MLKSVLLTKSGSMNSEIRRTTPGSVFMDPSFRRDDGSYIFAMRSLLRSANCPVFAAVLAFAMMLGGDASLGIAAPERWGERIENDDCQASEPPSSHRLCDQGPGSAPQVLRGGAGPAPGRHLVRGGRIVRRRAYLLPLLLRPRRRQRPRLLPVRQSR